MPVARSALCLIAAAALAGCGGGNINAKAMAAAEDRAAASTADRIATAYAGPKLRVAVGRFTVLEAAQALFEEFGWADLGPLMGEQVLTGLVQTNRVAVLERAQLDKVVANLNTETQGDMAQYFDQETTAETGKLLGAQAVLVGSITDFQPNVSGADATIAMPLLANLTWHKEKAVVAVEMRLVEQQTGRIIVAASGRGEMTTNEAGADISYKDLKVGTSTFGNTPIGEATRMAAREALEGLVGQLQKTPWEGDIASVDASGKVYIQAGADLSLKKGDVFEALRRGEPITDPDGNVLGYQEERLGTVEIQAVLPKLSVAAVIEGEAPAAGDRVRLAQ
ncbi:MAG: hypothetical protein H6702_09420 [Myxococcales bacterium]|nr:hypothetical protein [Myxococcales bacterium]